MCLPDPRILLIKDSKEVALLDPEKEDILLTQIAWWVEGISLKIRTNEALLGGQYHLPVKLKPLLKAPTYRIRVYKLLGFNRQASLRDNLFMDSFNLLIWNCRGAGIDNFKRNFKDLIRSPTLRLWVFWKQRLVSELWEPFLRPLVVLVCGPLW